MTVLLLAEDDPDLRDGLQRLFQRADFTVYAADNGDAAFRLAVSVSPDVVLTDLDMPGLDGAQLCAAIRARPEIGDVPVAILSGRLRAEDSVLRSAGVCAVLLKPVPNAELTAAVRDLVAYGPHSHATTPCHPEPAGPEAATAPRGAAAGGPWPQRAARLASDGPGEADGRTGDVAADPLADSRNEL
ncbi:response regulator [Krasilnikovia sp. MM14-A1259]|uniref:response regulator n=1 Tax=Krasilnikovia sp. MM14-A1259 TaxID=3373539 RepID=UPI0038058BA7